MAGERTTPAGIKYHLFCYSSRLSNRHLTNTILNFINVLKIVRRVTRRGRLTRVGRHRLSKSTTKVRQTFLHTTPRRRVYRNYTKQVLVVNRRGSLYTKYLNHTRHFRRVTNHTKVKSRRRRVLQARRTNNRSLRVAIPYNTRLVKRTKGTNTSVINRRRATTLARTRRLPHDARRIRDLLRNFKQGEVLNTISNDRGRTTNILARTNNNDTQLQLVLISRHANNINLHRQGTRLVMTLGTRYPTRTRRHYLYCLTFPHGKKGKGMLYLINVISGMVYRDATKFYRFILPLLRRLPRIYNHERSNLLFPTPFPTKETNHAHRRRYQRIFLWRGCGEVPTT